MSLIAQQQLGPTELRSYWLDLFTPKTWTEFVAHGGEVSGFREGKWNQVQRVNLGDYLLCYLTGIKRWVGILEVVSAPFWDESERIWEDEVYPARLRVRSLVALSPETAVPIQDLRDRLSFFREAKSPDKWQGKFRSSPNRLDPQDAAVIIESLRAASSNPIERAPDDTEPVYRAGGANERSEEPTTPGGRRDVISEAGTAYRCDTCGWVYDPAAFDGRSLADQPVDWVCPGCQSSIDQFSMLVPEDDLGEVEDEEGDGGGGGTGTPGRKVSANKADLSVYELHRQTQRGQLILQPRYQRYYVWSETQASQLVESIFLRLPLPLIYIGEEPAGGVYSVIDGQQRLTALFRFMQNEFPLRGLTIMRALNGKYFRELSEEDQQTIENFTLPVIRIERESDPDVKFEVFARLNTGSVKLNDQELRNAIYRGRYNDHLRTLARNPDFLRLLQQDAPHPRMADVELALRFAAWLNQTYLQMLAQGSQLKLFMNKEMELGRSYTDRELAKVEREFKKSVQLTVTVFGDKAFRRFTPGNEIDRNGQWEPRINKAVYDVVMYGFSQYPKSHVIPHAEAIYEALVDLMSTNTAFTEAITSGTTAPRRVKARFEIWSRTLDEILADEPQTRSFSYTWKRQLFDSNPTCEICDQRILTIDDAHVHHVKHYWRGGATLPANSALTHRYCNLAEGGGRDIT